MLHFGYTHLLLLPTRFSGTLLMDNTLLMKLKQFYNILNLYEVSNNKYLAFLVFNQ
jgi:hypothetical protein